MKLINAIFGRPYPEKREWRFDLFVIVTSTIAVLCISAIIDSYDIKVDLPKAQVMEVASSQAMPMGEQDFILLKEPTEIDLSKYPEFKGQMLQNPQKILECKGDVYLSVDRSGQIYLINLSNATVKVTTPKTFPGGVKLHCSTKANIIVAFMEEDSQNHVRLGD